MSFKLNLSKLRRAIDALEMESAKFRVRLRSSVLFLTPKKAHRERAVEETNR